MSCRIGSTSSDDSRKSLLPLHASGDDERKHGQSTRQQPTSRIAMCLCGLAILALVALSFAPQTTGSKPHRASASPSEAQSVGAILAKAGQRALGGGLGGAVAGACQVLALMWLRTVMNYQYRHGGSMSQAMRTLYAQGGVARFYQGLPYALLQTPLSRFGDTAANVGVLALFAGLMPGVPLGVRTACGSAAGATWRLAITPLDTLKTSLQVRNCAPLTCPLPALARPLARRPLALAWSLTAGRVVGAAHVRAGGGARGVPAHLAARCHRRCAHSLERRDRQRGRQLCGLLPLVPHVQRDG